MDYLLFIYFYLHLYLISDIEFVKQFYPHSNPAPVKCCWLDPRAGKVKYQIQIPASFYSHFCAIVVMRPL